MKKNTIILLLIIIAIFYSKTTQAADFYNMDLEIRGGGNVSGNLGQYPSNSIATMNVVPEDEVVFLGWGNGCSGSGSCIIRMDSDKRIFAYFMLNPNTRELKSPKILFPLDQQIIPATTSVTISWENIANSYMTRIQDLSLSGTTVIRKNFKTNSNSETFSVIPGHAYKFWIYSGMQTDHSTTSSSVIFSVADVVKNNIQPISSSTKSVNISLGQSSPDVLKLQKFLNNNGFVIAVKGNGSKGKESVYFGSLTKKALIKFQKSKGLLQTGVLDDATRKVVGL